MDVVIARFQRMSPPIFNGDESSEDADSWLHSVIHLFDRAHYYTLLLIKDRLLNGLIHFYETHFVFKTLPSVQLGYEVVIAETSSEEKIVYERKTVADVDLAAGSLERCVHCFGSWHQQRLRGFQQERAIEFRTQTLSRKSTSWYQTQHRNDVAPTNLNIVVLILNANTLTHLLITTRATRLHATTAFQEYRAKTRFDWFFHRPAASSQHQLTRQPAGLTLDTVFLKSQTIQDMVPFGLFGSRFD
ncbi:hypothetical protein F511_03713 [Dorcoceras hygrometricum]|uniref:Uncharacterized protein n=1 Tax=Dorcoceras hygrometricum TaxID=472368 RepID=A0A2Z7BEH8_9LAMI|nr:hypothetical protein F511_03713 [Dorcoceras hygrometricum]